MRKIMKLLALAIALFTSFSAQARSIEAVRTETLQVVKVDGQDTRFVGRLTLSYVDQKMTLEIYDDVCGQFAPAQPGIMRCMAAARIVESFEVPMQKHDQSCGSVIFSGVRDLRPVDGARTEIRVTNNATRLCEDVVLGRIVVEATVQSLRASRPTTYLLYTK
jgi:hypothetical protein